MLRSILSQHTKMKIKLLLNSEVLSFWAVAALLSPSLFGAHHRRSTFRAVYQQKKWGSEGDGADFFSGTGSRGAAVTEYVNRLASVLEQSSSFNEF